MLRKSGLAGLLLIAGFLTSCGTSTMGPDGSKHQTQSGVAETGYPGGQPKDAESPALSSSTEQNYAGQEVAKAGDEGKAEGKTETAK
jgi:hypothetical protein